MMRVEAFDVLGILHADRDRDEGRVLRPIRCFQDNLGIAGLNVPRPKNLLRQIVPAGGARRFVVLRCRCPRKKQSASESCGQSNAFHGGLSLVGDHSHSSSL